MARIEFIWEQKRERKKRWERDDEINIERQDREKFQRISAHSQGVNIYT